MHTHNVYFMNVVKKTVVNYIFRWQKRMQHVCVHVGQVKHQLLQIQATVTGTFFSTVCSKTDS